MYRSEIVTQQDLASTGGDPKGGPDPTLGGGGFFFFLVTAVWASFKGVLCTEPGRRSGVVWDLSTFADQERLPEDLSGVR